MFVSRMPSSGNRKTGNKDVTARGKSSRVLGRRKGKQGTLISRPEAQFHCPRKRGTYRNTRKIDLSWERVNRNT